MFTADMSEDIHSPGPVIREEVPNPYKRCLLITESSAHSGAVIRKKYYVFKVIPVFCFSINPRHLK